MHKLFNRKGNYYYWDIMDDIITEILHGGLGLIRESPYSIYIFAEVNLWNTEIDIVLLTVNKEAFFLESPTSLLFRAFNFPISVSILGPTSIFRSRHLTTSV